MKPKQAPSGSKKPSEKNRIKVPLAIGVSSPTPGLPNGVLTPNDVPGRPMRKVQRIAPEEAKQIAEAPGVAWEVEEKQIDGKSYRVLAGPSNNTARATNMAWKGLEKDACQVIAVTQSRNMSIQAVRRNFLSINKYASDDAIQKLLDAHEKADHEEDERLKLHKFGTQKWIADVIQDFAGVYSSTAQRYRRRINSRQKK